MSKYPPLLTAALAGLLVLASGGCATEPARRGEWAPSTPACGACIREAGVIGVISTSTTPKFVVQQPLSKEQAAKVWRETLTYGEFTDADPAFDARDVVLVQGTMGLGVAWLAAGAIAGQVIGAAKGISPVHLREANQVIHLTLGGLSLQELVRSNVVARAAGERQPPIRLVAKPFPPGQEVEYSQMACVMCATLAWLPRGQSAAQYLAAQGVDTILEIQLVQPGLIGKGGVNPLLHVVAGGRARLVSARTGEEWATVPLHYRGTGRKFTEWAADDAQPLRAEIDHCCRQLAAQTWTQLFAQQHWETLGAASCRRHALVSR